MGEGDRNLFLNVLGQVCERFNWAIHAWCEMTNHYHLLVETPDGNLSKGIRCQSGGYTLMEIGDYFGVHYSTVIVMVKRHSKPKT